MARKKKDTDVTIEQLEAELRSEKYRRSFAFSLRNTIFTLITVSAIAVLVAVLLMPVLQIYGSSMNPTLSEGEIVLSLKGSDFKTGDIMAFYYNNNILVKRVIAGAGDWVDIAEDGTVYVNNVALDEPYLIDKAYGETNIELPYQVPESRVFVMGDHRSVSIDSRNTAVGCVAEEQIVGKIVFRVWPLKLIGKVR
ncbi:MAG: signal peptidase I [Oscillospiraceae bacterium]|nr:signal peptidase I [Oscillospiraceae bacterium]